MTAGPLPTASLTGAVLSRRWRVGAKLGEGGMGEVYAGESVVGGARVALKVLRREFLGEEAVLARFVEEGRTGMGLVHPNIVRVFECAEAEDRTPYIVMDLLDGVPLGAYTVRGGRVPLAQAIPILHGILAGLAAAHAHGVVHRDLKPDNVFLTRDPAGTFVVKLLDFGLAKVMDAAGGMGKRTRSGVFLGTPAYMSPEQIKSARDVDPRSDLFSAGVLFYEMLAGRAAFPAPTEFAKMTAVLTTEPEPVERIDPALAPLGPFIARALKKERGERFASALDMARALTAASLGPAQQPLSRLPEVASMFAPSVALDAGGAAGAPAGAVPAEGAPPTLAAPGASPAGALAARPPGDTLASPAVPALVVAPAPQIRLVEAQARGGTLPSEDLPILEPSLPVRRGVAPAVVALLVAGGVIAGFLLGWTVGRI